MGQDIRVLLNHQLSTPKLATLHEDLNATREFWVKDALAIGLLEQKDKTLNWEWYPRPQQTMEKPEDKLIWIQYTEAIFLSIDIGIAELGYWKRWKLFGSDVKVTEAIRSITKAISRAIRADTAIYIPDSNSVPACGAEQMMGKGASFSELENYLLTNKNVQLVDLALTTKPAANCGANVFYREKFD